MKRSRSIKLVLMGTAALAVSACEEQKVDVGVFETLEQCTLSGHYSQAQCETALTEARREHVAAAPRFESRGQCEAQFGPGQCEAAPENANPQQAQASGGGWFMPLLAGYMMGRLMGPGQGLAGQPLYRSGGGFQTRVGDAVAPRTGMASIPAATTQRAAVSRPATQRGGFGASAQRFGSAST